MSWNTFGKILKVTTFGESHGPAIGCIVDGCPSKVKLSQEDIQKFLNERRPGQSRYTTQRQESDQVEILSGVLDGYTLGTPIALLIRNNDTKPKDYAEIADLFRPSHGDYVYWKKYGIRDHRGGGRSSARETAARVAAGAIARKILGDKIQIKAGVSSIGKLKADPKQWDWAEVKKNPLFCPDKSAVESWQTYLDSLRRKGTSAGAVISAVATGVPVGWGAPVYGKMEADLAANMISINAAKGFEIGSENIAEMEGEEAADEMQKANKSDKSEIDFVANNSGGVIAGITTGQDIVIRVAFKPTSSIRSPLKTVDKKMNNKVISTKGRHDPCVGIRAVPIVEAMLALTLADHFLLYNAYNI